MNSTIVALATPPGAGGIAVVRLSGPESYQIGGKVFRPRNPEKQVEKAKGYTALYGRFVDGETTLDEGVALFFRAPHSYTGEDVIELSCHGGMVIAQSLIQACIGAGAVPAGPGEYTKRAFLNGRISLTQAEGVMDVIAAAGRQGAALAESALNGSLAAAIEGCKTTLLELAGHLAAWVDFPEEDVPELEEQALGQALCGVKQQVESLISGYEAGAVLRHGVDAAIVGSPNVGKSTLLNLLSGFDRAIVTPIAGTTRDVVEQAVMLGGIRLNLFDTAGIHHTEDVVEAEGIRRSHRKLEEAGLVLAVFDGSRSVTQDDLELARRCSGKRAIALINKGDLERRFDTAQIADCFDQLVHITAGQGQGLKELEQAVQQVLGVAQLDLNAPCLVSQRQLSAAVQAKEALEQALEAMEAGYGLDAVSVCVDDGLTALCQLMGEDASEAVIEEVFSKFCVGK